MDQKRSKRIRKFLIPVLVVVLAAGAVILGQNTAGKWISDVIFAVGAVALIVDMYFTLRTPKNDNSDK
ncbi:MAG: hypothetical protein IJL88_06420 [Clostridia bacterium]|nr:hypothetical protein [Clostridia bacterium]